MAPFRDLPHPDARPTCALRDNALRGDVLRSNVPRSHVLRSKIDAYGAYPIDRVSLARRRMPLRSLRKAFETMTQALERRVVARGFSDPGGQKGWWTRLSRAPATQVAQVRITVAGWPRLARPVRLLFLSDLHVGSHAGDVERLGTILRAAAAMRPDLMCVGGDYVNGMLFGGGRVPPGTIAGILASLTPPLGSFAVLGDHDELYGAAEIAGALRDAGLTVLRDEIARIDLGGQEIAIVGTAPAATRLPELMARVRAGIPTIVLAHDPAAFARLPETACCLMLSGHTHGGQICLPLLGPVVNMSDAPLRWTYGRVVAGDSHLYVTSGLGTSVIPLRVGIPPEIVLIDLDGGTGSPASA